MADWEDIKDMYEVDHGTEPQVPQEPKEPYYAPPQPTPIEPRGLRVELPGLPGFMKRRGMLQLLAPKKEYRTAVQYAFAARAEKRQGFSQIHGGKSTAELMVRVCVKPPKGLPSRWKDSMYQSMMSGFIKPSTLVNLDYVIGFIARALCGRPLHLVRRRANFARISAEVCYAEHEGVIIELRRDKQFYSIHMR